MENRSVAVRGDPGAAGQDGSGGDPATREVIIYDADGTIVRRNRANDTAAAADRQIARAGYKRIGDWADGRANIRRKTWLERYGPLLGAGVLIAIAVAVAVPWAVERAVNTPPASFVKACESRLQEAVQDAGGSWDGTFDGEARGDSREVNGVKTWLYAAFLKKGTVPGVDIPAFACTVDVDSNNEPIGGTMKFNLERD
jgi:hypothetical protein